MESQPVNPEFRNNPENFYPCSGVHAKKLKAFSSTFNTVFKGCKFIERTSLHITINFQNASTGLQIRVCT